MTPRSLLVLLLFAAPCAAQTAPPDNRARALQILQSGMQDSNPNKRKQAALAVGILYDKPRAARLVWPLLADKDPEVRLAAITALSDLDYPGALPAFRESLQDPIPEVAFAAAKALWVQGQPLGKEALLAVLGGDKKAKSNAFSAKYRDMMRMMHTPKTALLFGLKTGMGFVPVPGVSAGYGALSDLLFDETASPRAAVALMLAKSNDPEVLRALQDALSDDDWSVRAAAAQAIASRDDPALAPSLIPLLDDDNEKVTYRAAASYLRLLQLKDK